MKENLTEDNRDYKCLLPTNLAAILINCTAIHNFSCKLKKFKSFMKMKLDYIFVDEEGILHSNFYKILMIFKKLKNFYYGVCRADTNTTRMSVHSMPGIPGQAGL